MDIKTTVAETMPMIRNRLQHGDQREKKLREACADFEAMFWNEVLKSMRKTLDQDNPGVDGHQKEMFESMFDQELARQISRSEKALGLAGTFYNHLSETVSADKK
ncbi:hypothetical protein JCM14469_05530 [Desulfatiferula olefinivorans]